MTMGHNDYGLTAMDKIIIDNMQAEIDRLKAECINAVEVERVLTEQIHRLKAEIAATHAQIQLDSRVNIFNQKDLQIETLKAELQSLRQINQELWEHLTPEVRHVLNVKYNR